MNDSFYRGQIPTWRLLLYAVFAGGSVIAILHVMGVPVIGEIIAGIIGFGVVMWIWFLDRIVKQHPDQMRKYAPLMITIGVGGSIILFLWGILSKK